jgi:hypothetical protein
MLLCPIFKNVQGVIMDREFNFTTFQTSMFFLVCINLYKKFITNDFLRQIFKIFGWPSTIIISVTCARNENLDNKI